MSTKTSTEAGLLELWATVTRGGLLRRGGAHRDIAPETDFFHLGGNSLLLIKLQASIRKVYGVTVRLVELLEHSSLGKMASLVWDKDKDMTTPTIDWEAETEVPSEWVHGDEKQADYKAGVTTTRRVVMTGPSGFLGVKLHPPSQGSRGMST
ncbi:lovastatin nonaketide synthase [Colletotrichum higginsianum]|nr:lovastatin nonaketide synthase [Colletotrichum higginsianum]